MLEKREFLNYLFHFKLVSLLINLRCKIFVLLQRFKMKLIFTLLALNLLQLNESKVSLKTIVEYF